MNCDYVIWIDLYLEMLFTRLIETGNVDSQKLTTMTTGQVY